MSNLLLALLLLALTFGSALIVAGVIGALMARQHRRIVEELNRDLGL